MTHAPFSGAEPRKQIPFRMAHPCISIAHAAGVAAGRTLGRVAMLAALIHGTSCATAPQPQARGVKLPARSRVGWVTYSPGPASFVEPQTPAEAARSGWERATNMPFGPDPGENVVFGMASLAIIPFLAGAGALQGVPEKDRAAATSVVQRVHSSVDWRALFEAECRRHAAATTTYRLEMAPRPPSGFFNPEWRGRYEAVLAVDFRDPSLEGAGGPNPGLWTETSIYWTLIDPASGKSMAGGPLVTRSPERRSFLAWTRNEGSLLADSFAGTVREAAIAVVQASLIP